MARGNQRPKKPKKKPPQATGSTLNPSTKRQNESTHTESGHTQKSLRCSTPPPRVDVGALYIQTPATKRIVYYSSMTSDGSAIYAEDMEAQIVAEARGVTRKNVPWDTFRSICLWNVEGAGAQPKLKPELNINSIRKIGDGSWEEGHFWIRLRRALHDKVLHGLKLAYTGHKSLSGGDGAGEVLSKPDFIIHTHEGNGEPTWADVELLFEHTRSDKKVVTSKFSQWLRCAWSVFHHQPFRHYLYGIMFIFPNAYICYADHGCAAYSEPLNFTENEEHTRSLTNFLSGFIAKPECRGKDPTVQSKDGRVCIEHAGKTWSELLTKPLWYRPCIVGRHIRVAKVREFGAEPPQNLVMKSTWEEKIPPESSPPPEVEVLRILLRAGVRGLPQPYCLDDDHLEVETRSFPKDCEVAFPVINKDSMAKMKNNFISGRTSKTLVPPTIGGIVGDKRLSRVQRVKFNTPIETPRRLTRVIMSYCIPLKEAMRNAGPKSLMRTIRDAMIVYYEVYKHPKAGFLHGDISIENILVPMSSSQLTGDLTGKNRRGTLVDWNLCFSADGTSSGRNFRSGTAAFMAPTLLSDKPVARRTLVHDMESFFAVIIWIASFDYDDDDRFQNKPLASALLKKDPADIGNAKKICFGDPVEFRELILKHLEPLYSKDTKFQICLVKLRRILYSRDDIDEVALVTNRHDENKAKEMEGPDQMNEGQFRNCMEMIDEYFGDKEGCDEIMHINSLAPAPHSQTSESIGEGKDGSG